MSNCSLLSVKTSGLCKCYFFKMTRNHCVTFEFILTSLAVTSNVFLIWLGWFMNCEINGCPAAVLLDAASRICLKQHTVSLCSSHQDFSQNILFDSKLCSHTVVLIRLGRILILFYLKEPILCKSNSSFHVLIFFLDCTSVMLALE